MSLPRLTDRYVVWRALIDAQLMAETICDSYSWDDDEQVVQEHKRLMGAYERIAQRYYGRGIAETMNEPFKNSRPVPITEIWKCKDTTKERSDV